MNEEEEDDDDDVQLSNTNKSHKNRTVVGISLRLRSGGCSTAVSLIALKIKFHFVGPNNGYIPQNDILRRTYIQSFCEFHYLGSEKANA